jgi:PPOX class probable FMN-dependent enzyme
MSIAPWRSRLSGALHRNRSLIYSRYVQLATLRLDGTPANRTIVFRGFLDETNILKFITDSRSQKTEEINHNHQGEICWYLPKTREQFRITGKLILVGENHKNLELIKARESLWQEISDAAKTQFYWPEPRQKRAEPEHFTPPNSHPIKPLSNFLLLLLEPEKVDHLELRGEPQNRHFYWQNQEGIWLSEVVNP